MRARRARARAIEGKIGETHAPRGLTDRTHTHAHFSRTPHPRISSFLPNPLQCQKAHWKLHKSECQQIVAALAAEGGGAGTAKP